jgi:hypothetical protein
MIERFSHVDRIRVSPGTEISNPVVSECAVTREEMIRQSCRRLPEQFCGYPAYISVLLNDAHWREEVLLDDSARL